MVFNQVNFLHEEPDVYIHAFAGCESEIAGAEWGNTGAIGEVIVWYAVVGLVVEIREAYVEDSPVGGYVGRPAFAAPIFGAGEISLYVWVSAIAVAVANDDKVSNAEGVAARLNLGGIIVGLGLAAERAYEAQRQG